MQCCSHGRQKMDISDDADAGLMQVIGLTSVAHQPRNIRGNSENERSKRVISRNESG